MEEKEIYILIADDNSVNQRVVDLSLKEKGFHLDFASNGEEAVRCCRETAYDLILMDLQMPVMDGLEACRQIRSDKAYVKIPVIALSGSLRSHYESKFIDAGMTDMLEKPFSKEELLSTIDKWLAIGKERSV